MRTPRSRAAHSPTEEGHGNTGGHDSPAAAAADRRAALRVHARGLGLDGALIAPGQHRLAAFTGRLSGAAADAVWLWVPATGDPVLVVRDPADRARLGRGTTLPAVTARDPLAVLPAHAGRIGVLLAGPAPGAPAGRHPAELGNQAVTCVDLTSWAAETLQAKSGGEVLGLGRAAATGEAALRAATGVVTPRVTDVAVVSAVESAARAAGAYEAECLVAFGDGTAPATPQGALLGPGEPVVLELRLRHGGFATRVQCTVLPPEAAERDRAAVEMCHEVREAVLARLTPGAPVATAVAAGTRVLADHGLLDVGEYSFGHGIGWDTVESPCLVSSSTRTVTAWSVLVVRVALRHPSTGGAVTGGPVVVEDGGCRELVPGACWTRSHRPAGDSSRHAGRSPLGLTSPHVAELHGRPSGTKAD